MTSAKPMSADDPRHGTINGYCNLRCRCEACREVWRSYFDKWKKSRPSLAADDPRHGTYNGYINYRCKCEACIEARRAFDLGQRSNA